MGQATASASTQLDDGPMAGKPMLRWPLWLAAIPVMVAGLAVTHSAWADITHIAWTDEESSHVLLVPIVFCWLLWVYHGRLHRTPVMLNWLGPLIVLGAWALSTYGYIRAHQVFWHLGALLTVLGCLVSVVGWAPIRRLWPAFLVLLFAVPVPGRIRQEIALPMQNIAAQVTEALLTVMGIEVARAGNMLSINGTQVNIAEACNGLRMVMALFLVSYTFAFVNPLKPWVRLLLIAASPVLAIAGNVLRLVPTVWVFGNFSHDAAERLHDLFGWVMLVVAYFLLMGVIGVLRWAYIPVTDDSADKEEAQTSLDQLGGAGSSQAQANHESEPAAATASKPKQANADKTKPPPIPAGK